LILLAILIILLPVFAQGTVERLGFWTVCLVGIAVMFYCRSLARSRERLLRAGLIGALFDLSLLAYMPLSQWLSIGSGGLAPATMLETRSGQLGILLIIVNSLALRPLLPMLVAIGALLVDLAVKAYVLSRPQVTWTLDLETSLVTDAFYLPPSLGQAVGIAVAGLFLVWLTKSARLAVHQAASLERANAEIKERQAQLIVEAKVSSLTGLVAGIAHEVNTPLGVLLSAVATTGQSVPKVSEAIETAENIGALRSDGRLVRVLKLMAETPKVANEAGQRIARLVGTLKDFAHLDEADVQTIDPRDALDRSLGVISPRLRGAVEVAKDYQDVPGLKCRPRELNQVFETILTNAFESMAGKGTLTLDVRNANGSVVIAIADTGIGMSAEALDRLFDISFAAGDGRMKMGLGLPTSRVIVQRMGGTLTASSEPGQGSELRIELPVSGS
jgi:signal transduction histidine kinase